jgi:RimJ/RimL family protein N-acetyltransferase
VIQAVDHTTISIPTFEEGRLRYRAPRWDDFEAYAEFRGSDRARGVGGPHSRGSSFVSFAEILGHWHLRGYGRWLIADRETDAPLGVVGLMYPEDWPEPEIAWSVFADAEGKGFASEAARFTRRYAYNVLGWTTLISCTLIGNTQSEVLAERLEATYGRDFDHPNFGTLKVWRHLGPEALT